VRDHTAPYRTAAAEACAVGKTDPAPPFALKNLAMQLHFYLVEPPRVIGTPLYVIAGTFGTALTYRLNLGKRAVGNVPGGLPARAVAPR
jgi:hypothetical protein